MEIVNTVDKFDRVTPVTEDTLEKTTMSWFQFAKLSRKQQDGDIEYYITEFKSLANPCELDNLRDGVVKDIMIYGLRNDELRLKLLDEDHKTLEEAVIYCINMENNRERNKAISGKTEDNIDAVWQGSIEKELSTMESR
ncbi:hypothetical protein JTB14_016227 [Gonioctena quinquepunctata]|nr:hypothetical protein JTB14_016227 [Gonioctena quinquepunctata]